ncbi:MAG: hypothetical protein IPI11_14750 [Haliscomenobacter sp.]|nr:hypothetical protein [Haliscomenobacter sp.]
MPNTFAFININSANQVIDALLGQYAAHITISNANAATHFPERESLWKLFTAYS